MQFTVDNFSRNKMERCKSVHIRIVDIKKQVSSRYYVVLAPVGFLKKIMVSYYTSNGTVGKPIFYTTFFAT